MEKRAEQLEAELKQKNEQLSMNGQMYIQMKPSENDSSTSAITTSTSEKKELNEAQKQFISLYIVDYVWPIMKLLLPRNKSLIDNPRLIDGMYKYMQITDDNIKEEIRESCFKHITRGIGNKRGNALGSVQKKYTGKLHIAKGMIRLVWKNKTNMCPVRTQIS